MDHMDQFLNEMDMSECVVHPKKLPVMAIVSFLPDDGDYMWPHRS